MASNLSNYYETLGISPQAEDIVIRAAYRALAQRYHPDKADEPKTQAALRMRAIQQAYQVLSNPASRAAYDAELASQDSESWMVSARSPHSIANIEAQAWEILLRLHPDLGSNLSRLETKQMHLAQTYRSLLLELISEKLVSQLVQSICEEIKDVSAQPSLNSIATSSRNQIQ